MPNKALSDVFLGLARESGSSAYIPYTTLSGDVNATTGTLGNLTTQGTLEIASLLKLTGEEEVTIASGVITISKSVVYVDTQSAAASDDLDTINPASIILDVDGTVLLLEAADDARTITLRHDTGNIFLASGSSFRLDSTRKKILLRRRGDEWHEISRGGDEVGLITNPPLDQTSFDVLEAHVGVAAAVLPPRLTTTSNVVFSNWDTSRDLFYADIPDPGGGGAPAYIRHDGTAAEQFIWPTGPYGNRPTYSIYYAAQTKFVMEFTMRNWSASHADSALAGVGASNGVDFSTGHYFSLRNNGGGGLILRTRDGSTASDSASLGTPDAGVYRIEWAAALITVYKDGVSLGTKATNLPDRALGIVIHTPGTPSFDISYLKCSWE